MHTVTIQVKSVAGMNGIRALSKKRSIDIVEEVECASPALEGKRLSIQAFKEWINDAEQQPALSLKKVRSEWERKKKELLKSMK